MPLNRPALSLGPGPRGVQDARRWVGETCREIGRPELVECAELGVSELVTNALLHGGPPISVRVRGTREHPRVEVRDGSRDRPVLPGESVTAADDEDLLLTFGRGLSIVARCADAWGAEVEDDGKVVWFAPAVDIADDDGVPGVVTGPTEDDADRRPSLDDPVHIRVRAVPLGVYLGFQRHFRELRREVRLLALAHESAYPVAKSLSDMFGSLERQLSEGIGADQIEAALAGEQESADLEAVMSLAATLELTRFVELLDLADEFCREERLLSLARTPEQRDFQRWFLGEFVRQAQGQPPLAWSDAVTSGRRSPVS